MKNVRASQLKTCIILTNTEYDALLHELYPDSEIETEYTLEGISIDIDGDCVDTDDLHKKLAEYFDVHEVTSTHMDDCEYSIGVWIVYRN